MRVSRLVKILTLAGSVALAAGLIYQRGHKEPLPCYELRLTGGRATYLDSQPVQALDAQSRLSITLRPERAVTRRVFVSAVVEEQSQKLMWPVLFERTPQGALILQGPLHELWLPCRRRCTVTLYISDFILFPSLFWLVPESYRSVFLPRAQMLRADLLIEQPVVTLGPLASRAH